MSLKKRIVLTIFWLALIVCLGFATLRGIWLGNSPIRQREAQAALAGSGFAAVSAIGIAILWFPWVYQFGKRIREKRELRKRTSTTKQSSHQKSSAAKGRRSNKRSSTKSKSSKSRNRGKRSKK